MIRRLAYAATLLLAAVPLAATPSSAFFCDDAPRSLEGAAADVLNPGEIHTYRHDVQNSLHDDEYTFTLHSVGGAWVRWLIFDENDNCAPISQTAPVPWGGLCAGPVCDSVWVAPVSVHQISIWWDPGFAAAGPVSYVLTGQTSSQHGEFDHLVVTPPDLP